MLPSLPTVWPADGGRYDIAEKSWIWDKLVVTGASEDDATVVVKQFVMDVAYPGDIRTLALATVVYVDATNRSVPAVGRDFSRAFSGTVDGIRELDVKLNFLMADDYEKMPRLQKEGKFRDAKNVAMAALVTRLTKLLGKWYLSRDAVPGRRPSL